MGPHSIMVAWGAPESDGGAPLEGYKVAVRDEKRHMWMEVGRVSADVQKLKVQELAEGNLYFLRIYAKNEVGFSPHLENEEAFKVVRPAGKWHFEFICFVHHMSKTNPGILNLPIFFFTNFRLQ